MYMALAETILSQQYLDDHPEYCREEDVSSAIGLQLPKPVNARLNKLCKIAFITVCKQELIKLCQKASMILAYRLHSRALRA